MKTQESPPADSNGFLGLSVHPDGGRIAFASLTMSERVGAIWAMENFLSKD